MNRRIMIRLLVLLALVGIVAVIYASGADHWLTIAQLKAHRNSLLTFVDAHFVVALLVSMSLYIVLVALSIPIADVLTLLCGMLFGRWLGTAVVVISASIGTTLALLLIRYLAMDFVRSRIHTHPRIKRLLTSFDRHADSYVLVLRLVPLFPFWLVNIALALTNIRARRVLLFTLIGIIPGSFVYANVGANIAHIDTAHDLVSIPTLLALVLLALLALLPIIIRHFLHIAIPIEEER